jgi:hypothetical protein
VSSETKINQRISTILVDNAALGTDRRYLEIISPACSQASVTPKRHRLPITPAREKLFEMAQSARDPLHRPLIPTPRRGDDFLRPPGAVHDGATPPGRPVGLRNRVRDWFQSLDRAEIGIACAITCGIDLSSVEAAFADPRRQLGSSLLTQQASTPDARY